MLFGFNRFGKPTNNQYSNQSGQQNRQNNNQYPAVQQQNMQQNGQLTQQQQVEQHKAFEEANREAIQELIKSFNNQGDKLQENTKKENIKTENVKKENTKTEQKPKVEQISKSPIESKQLKITEFAQGESNGESYYKHLSSIAPTPYFKSLLLEISENCTKRKQAFCEIHKEFYNSTIEIQQLSINKAESFSEGIEYAIVEEAKSIAELSGFFSEIKLKDQSNLTCQIFKKIADLSFLNLMLRY